MDPSARGPSRRKAVREDRGQTTRPGRAGPGKGGPRLLFPALLPPLGRGLLLRKHEGSRLQTSQRSSLTEANPTSRKVYSAPDVDTVCSTAPAFFSFFLADGAGNTWRCPKDFLCYTYPLLLRFEPLNYALSFFFTLLLPRHWRTLPYFRQGFSFSAQVSALNFYEAEKRESSRPSSLCAKKTSFSSDFLTGVACRLQCGIAGGMEAEEWNILGRVALSGGPANGSLVGGGGLLGLRYEGSCGWGEWNGGQTQKRRLRKTTVVFFHAPPFPCAV